MPEIGLKDICVLIPAYNEEKNIGRVLESLKALGCAAVVIDDGSSDATSEISRAAGAHVLRCVENQGKGASIRQGFLWARNKEFAAVALIDADGQHDVSELPLFIAALKHADVVIGNRMSRSGKMPFLRVLTNWLMSLLISAAARQRVPDSQCGYRLLRKKVIETIWLRTPRFEIESEMILAASRAGFRIGAVPIRSVYEGGPSHIRPVRDTCRFLYFFISYLFSKKD